MAENIVTVTLDDLIESLIGHEKKYGITTFEMLKMLRNGELAHSEGLDEWYDDWLLVTFCVFDDWKKRHD